MVLALIVVPIGTVLLSLFQEDKGTLAHIIDTTLLGVFVNSVFLMIGVGGVSLLLGVVPAWWVTMYRFPGSRRYEWLLIVPLAFPAYVLALCYGALSDAIAWFPPVRSFAGAIIILSLSLYPYIYLLARTAFLSQSVHLLHTGRVLGYTQQQLFWKLSIPMARPALIAGVSLVLMETLADIGVVYLFGVDTFTTSLYRTWYNLFDLVAAAQMAAGLLLFILLLLWVERRSRRQARFCNNTGLYHPLPVRNAYGVKGWAMAIGCGLPIIAGVIIPLSWLVYWSIYVMEAEWYYTMLEPLLTSVMLAVVTAIIIVGLAIILAYAVRLFASSVWVVGLVRIATIGYAIPGSVIAVGVFIALNTADQWLHSIFPGWGLWLSGSIVALLVAYVIRFITLPFNSLESSLETVSTMMDDVARTLGKTPAGIVRFVHFPIIKGGLYVSVLMVMVDVIKELPATLILRPFNMDSLAIRVFELAIDERVYAAAPAALLLVFIGCIPVIYLGMQLTKSRVQACKESHE